MIFSPLNDFYIEHGSASSSVDLRDQSQVDIAVVDPIRLVVCNG